MTRSGNPEHPDYTREARGPNGRGLCRRCLTEVPRGRYTFCGDPCVQEWLAMKDPAERRSQVGARDEYVC